MLYYAARFQFLNRIAVITQLRQHFLSVLAEQRRRAEKLRRRPRHIDWAADQIAHAHLRMFDLFWDTHVLDLWIIEHLVNRVDRRVGDAMRVEARQPIVAPLLGKSRAQQLDDFVVVIAALFARRETRVAD